MAIIQKPENSFTSNGTKQSSSFKISSNPHAFEILSARIYSNKIRAVIREVSTNAVDSHIDARKVSLVHKGINSGLSIPQIAKSLIDNFGTRQNAIDYVRNEIVIRGEEPLYDLSDWIEKPVEVHIPNINEPFFYVRDYGTGLSHDMIMQMYTTYFDSNKQTSNDYTGCLGLGSKSPFAYSQSFTVTSFFNGEKRSYHANVEEGFPQISIFQDESGNPIVEKTDEPNGLKVQVQVRENDIQEFRKEAKYLYSYFKYPINIVGYSELNEVLKEERYSFKGSNWGIRQDDRYGTPRAIMGNVCYPIDQVKVNIFSSPIDIEFELGELEPTPSRESLSYKKSVINAIQSKIKKIENEASSILIKAVEDCECEWDAKCELKEIRNSGISGKYYHVSNIAGDKHKNSKLDLTPIFIGTKINVLVFYDKGKYKQTDSIAVSKSTKIYENDLGVGYVGRMRSVYTGKPLYLVTFENDQQREEFVNKLGMKSGTTFTPVSSIASPASSRSTGYRKIHEDEVYILRKGYENGPLYSYWDGIENPNMSEGGVYVGLNRFNSVDRNGVKTSPTNTYLCLKSIKSISENENLKVYGLKGKALKIALKSDKWIHFDDYIESLVKSYFIDKNEIDLILAKKKYKWSYDNGVSYDEFACFYSVYNKLPDGIFKDLVKLCYDIQNVNAAKLYDIQRLFNHSGLSVELPEKTTINLKDLKKTVLDKYPMISYTLGESVASNNVLNYVKTLELETVKS